MARTAHRIQSDIRSLIEGSSLAGAVSGKVYRGNPEDSDRPRDSKLEDIVVVFTTGTPEQIHEGVVTVKIYVPDIDTYGNGDYVEDGKRCEALEVEADKWYESLHGRTDYLFGLQDTIHTQSDPEIGQHFVVVRLRYRCLEENS